MKTKYSPLNYGLLIVVFALSSCTNLPALNDEEEAIEIPLGPKISLQEHQTLVFENLWGYLEQNYIYYETSDINWEALHQTYTERIESGLTSEEFSSLLHELESDLPENEVIFQSRAERIEAELVDTNTYVGIGAFVGFEEDEVPHIVILDVMPNSPGEDAGLQAHDSILAIDGEPILLEEGLNAVNRIRGPAGTTTILTIQSPGEKDREVELIRTKLTGAGILKIEELEEKDVGYVLFPPTGSNSMMDQLLSALTEFSANKEFKGLILDLRISNSNDSWPLEAMLTLFEDGSIGEIYNRNESQILSLNGQDQYGSQSMPIAILIGENTRGLPEIFAASMQSNERATIIGSNTPGYIETLNGYLLPDGSQVFIASASFHFSSGDKIGINGIRPEVRVEARWDEIIHSEDPVIQAALEVFEVEQ